MFQCVQGFQCGQFNLKMFHTYLLTDMPRCRDAIASKNVFKLLLQCNDGWEIDESFLYHSFNFFQIHPKSVRIDIQQVFSSTTLHQNLALKPSWNYWRDWLKQSTDNQWNWRVFMQLVLLNHHMPIGGQVRVDMLILLIIRLLLFQL